MRARVTGANRGIGLAVSRALDARGIDVVVSARRFEDADVGLGTPVELDVTDDASVSAAVKEIGSVDILVNNAGVLLDDGTPPDRVDLDVVARTLEVNALGAWRVSQAVLPGMVERGRGRIVMISSGTGAFSHGLFAGLPAYSVSKATLNAVTVLLASSVRGTGVLVNAVNPGRVRTRMVPDASVSPDEAAADVVWAATLPDDSPTGTFFRARKPTEW